MKSGSLPPLATIRRDPWLLLKQAGRRHPFHKKDVLFRAGEPAEELYLLDQGRVRLFNNSAQGRSLTLSVVEAGDIFGETALYPDQHRASYAQALSDGFLYAIPRRWLERLLADNPAMALQIMENLGRRLQAVERRLGDLVFKSVPERLAALLVDMAGPAGQRGLGPTPLPHRYTHQQLADMINTHRETVTKVFNRFRDDRLLEFDRHSIVLLDMERLREMALR